MDLRDDPECADLPEYSIEMMQMALDAITAHCPKNTCRHCGHPIIGWPSYRGTAWNHVHGFAIRGSGTVGCRAASFNRLGTWDDSLPRHWVAEPERA